MGRRSGDSAAEDLDNAIRQNAERPARANGDGVSVQQHKITDRTDADKRLASKDAATGKGLGVKLVKLPPGETV